MVSLTGKSLITRSIPPNDHCFYVPSFPATEVLLHGFLALFFSFGLEHFVNKKRYQDRYEREVNLSTNVYTEHGEQNWNSSTNSLLILMNSVKYVHGTFFFTSKFELK